MTDMRLSDMLLTFGEQHDDKVTYTLDEYRRMHMKACSNDEIIKEVLKDLERAKKALG